MWPRDGETAELLSAVEEGDHGAVNSLLARHREALRRVIDLRIDPAVTRRLDASDVVQEVLLEASGRLEQFARDRPMPFHLWLRRIAMDRLVDAHRRHRLARKRSVDREQRIGRAAYGDQSSLDLVEQLRDRGPTPAAAAMRRELARRFELAIETLSDEDREVILMRHFEQLSNSEVADLTGVSQAAAGMRHLRALRRLRAVLGEELSTHDREER